LGDAPSHLFVSISIDLRYRSAMTRVQKMQVLRIGMDKRRPQTGVASMLGDARPRARAAANPLSAALGAAVLRRALAAAAYDSLQKQVFSALKTDQIYPLDRRFHWV
jgi:hypothetical protein